MSDSPIVFFVFDDMMHERDLGDYGFTLQEVAPNLLNIRQRGYDFRHAFASSPTCHASRVAMFSGTHPVESGIVVTQQAPETDASQFDWVQSWFQDQGWRTESWGKVFHNTGDFDEPDVWDYSVPAPPRARSHGQGIDGMQFGPSHDPQPDEVLVDQLLPRLADLTDKEILFVGFRFPHIPLTPPQEYFDMFDPSRVVPPERYPEAEPVPGSLASKFLTARGTLEELEEAGLYEEFIAAYLASVRFADDQLGRALAAIPEGTRIVITSDHGWALGERGSLKKGQVWAQAARVTLIVDAPEIYAARGDSNTSLDLTRLPEILKGLVTDTAIPMNHSDVAVVAFHNNNADTFDRVHARSVTGQSYTLIKHFDGHGNEELELYLRGDREQRFNLIANLAEKLL